MNRTTPSLFGIVDNIDREQNEQIKRRSLNGHIRSVELRWRQEMTERFGESHIVPTWTGRQRENCRDLMARYGKSVAQLLIAYSVVNWKNIRIESQLPVPPTPTFDALYANRDTFYSYMERDQEKKQKEKAEKETKPTVSLTQLFQEQRTKRLQEQDNAKA